MWLVSMPAKCGRVHVLSVAVFPINYPTWSLVAIIAKTPGLWQASAQYFGFFNSTSSKIVNLCTAVIIAPSRVSVKIPLRKFKVVLVSPFAMVRLEKEQAIDEPVPDEPRPALAPVVVGLAAY